MPERLPEVVLTCGHCGGDIPTRAAERSSTRCPRCGRTKKVPVGRGTRPTRRAPLRVVEPGEREQWEPEPVIAADLPAGEVCGECGTSLVWEPCGTLMWCPSCDVPLFPAGLEPGDDGDDPRHVPTRAERDAEGLALAGYREVALTAVRGALDDERLRPGVRGRLKWYAAEIEAADSRARIDELARMLQAEKISRDGWFTRAAPNPALAIDAEVIDADDQDEDEDEGTYVYDASGALVPAVQADDGTLVPATTRLALPSAPLAPSARDSLELRGYRIATEPRPGQCQTVATRSPTGQQIPPTRCPGAATGTFGPYRVCERHRTALADD